jgi:prevent-host-death family protein
MEAPIGEVKKHFCDMVDRAEKGETVVILRHGRPVARLMPLAENGKRWRIPNPEPDRYKGVDLNEPILGEI